MVESGFDPSANSSAGAGGVWQFIQSSARAYGLEVSYWVDRRRDPEAAAEAAAKYLKDLFVRFGSWPLAFAAYNAGYGAVLKSIVNYNTNDYWELIEHEAALPFETSLYVPKIIACAIVGHNRELFGVNDLAADPPLSYETFEVPPGTHLAHVARAAHVDKEVLESLNPELIRHRAPPDRGPYQVRLPPGTRQIAISNFETSRSARDRVSTIILRYGETIDDIAKARGISVRELRRLNGLSDNYELKGGMSIVVPERKVAPASAVEKALANVESDAAEAILVAVPERRFFYPDRERVFFRCRGSESLDELSGVFGVSVDNLVEWNNLDAAARLQEGMIIQVFIHKEFDARHLTLLDPSRLKVVRLGSEEFLALQAAQKGKTRLTYQARQGDTLASIARRYGLRPADLARINRMAYNSELESGQEVIVYSPTGDMPSEVQARTKTRRPGRGQAAETQRGARGKARAREQARRQAADRRHRRARR
jgi:membrane-bound lytic murein transglycosylase D